MSFARRTVGIPRQQYDRSYFLSDRCEGFREFVADRGVSHVKERLLTKVAPQAGEQILELGAGRGEVLLACARKGARAVGIDYSRDAVSLARETCGAEAEVFQADAAILPFRNGLFDKVLLGDVLEHLTARQAAAMIGEVHRVLASGGRLVLHTSPNVLFIRLVFPWLLLGLASTGRWRMLRLFWEQYRTIREFHVREYSAGRLRRLFRGSPFARVGVECDPDLLRGGRSRYTESFAASPLIRRFAELASREPLRRLFSNDLWVIADKA
jgi:ubiquinone/menaquinone biosynthesis C-methylase UbiE